LQLEQRPGAQRPYGQGQLVADAGQTMVEIVCSVQRVTDIIGEISAAASEQSEGIGQVNGSEQRRPQGQPWSCCGPDTGMRYARRRCNVRKAQTPDP
jgi:hypothetical protein